MSTPPNTPKPAAITAGLLLLALGSASFFAFVFIFDKNPRSPGGILTAGLALLLPILAVLTMQSAKKRT